MKDLNLYLKLLESYILNRTEWFWQYRVCFVLYILFIDVAVLYVLIGESVMVSIIILLFKVALAVHVCLSMSVVYKDYIYNNSVVFVCRNLTYLLVFKCLMVTL